MLRPLCKVVGQVGIEPTVSGVITRMGDHTLLSHMAAGSPAGGLCLLSAIRKRREKTAMAHCRGGRCRIRTDCLLLCCKRASASTYRPFEGGAGPPRYAPDPGIVRTSAAGRTRTSLCHGSTALSQPIPCPRHRAAAYLRVPSVRLSSVTAFRFATAFSPCGGAGLSRLSSVGLLIKRHCTERGRLW